ncbi:MAG TPA: hypothetical protein PLC54_02035, partial [Spirochaetales bacterium]|nr:hypothetical protein [Spirochaetales bacterium]
QYGTALAQSTLEEEIASLKSSMDDLARRLQEKDARVVQLEADLAAMSALGSQTSAGHSRAPPRSAGRWT